MKKSFYFLLTLFVIIYSCSDKKDETQITLRYNLTKVITPSGDGTVPPSSKRYNEGQNINLKATSFCGFTSLPKGFRDGYQDWHFQVYDVTTTQYWDSSNLPKGVIVKTNKKEYSVSEIIEVSFFNNTIDSVFSHIGSYTPVYAINYVERKDRKSNWKQFFAQCQYPTCLVDIDIPVIVKPKQTISFKWEPIIFINGSAKYRKLKKGLYRIQLLYQIPEKTKWKTTYSNEFIIK